MKDNSKAREVLAKYKRLQGATACGCGSSGCDYMADEYVTKQRAELKAQLAKLPHVMNKKEGKAARRLAAKKGK